MTFYRSQKRYGDTIKLSHVNVLVISYDMKNWLMKYENKEKWVARTFNIEYIEQFV